MPGRDVPGRTGVSSAAPSEAPPVRREAVPAASSFAEWMAETLRREGITKEVAAGRLDVVGEDHDRWLGGQTEPRLRELRRIQERFGEVRLC